MSIPPAPGRPQFGGSLSRAAQLAVPSLELQAATGEIRHLLRLSRASCCRARTLGAAGSSTRKQNLAFCRAEIHVESSRLTEPTSGPPQSFPMPLASLMSNHDPQWGDLFRQVLPAILALSDWSPPSMLRPTSRPISTSSSAGTRSRPDRSASRSTSSIEYRCTDSSLWAGQPPHQLLQPIIKSIAPIPTRYMATTV